MIRVRATVDIQPLDNLEAFFDQFPAVAFEQFQDAANEIIPDMLDELRFYPGPVVYPIDWQTEKQHRAFFATDGFGAGIPYQRTGRLKEGWRAETVRESDNIMRLIVENDDPKAKFVVGGLQLDPARALEPQQRMHRNTGWQPAHETVTYWVNAFREGLLSRFRNIGSVAFKRRASQSRRRV